MNPLALKAVQYKLQKRSQLGFTLIEVLVALVVLSLSMVAVIQLTSNHIKTMSELEKRVIASWVASNHLSEIKFTAKSEGLNEGNDSERVKMGGRNWRSRARITETDVENVFLVSVEVTEQAERDPKVYASMTTAMTDPR